MASPQISNTSKRPRPSLQIRTACNQPSKGPRGRALDPSDPTTFNTMSNIYVTAIERSSSVLPYEPMNELESATNAPQDPRLQTPDEKADLRPRFAVLCAATHPETLPTAQPVSPQQTNLVYPGRTTAAPPLSAGAPENTCQVFTFSSADTRPRRKCQPARSPVNDGTPFGRKTALPPAELPGPTPYAHPRSLHSILRNSPLAPKTGNPSPSPRRQSLRLQEKAAKKVEYTSPLEEEIQTFKYTRSHIDLLAEDGAPLSPPAALSGAEPGSFLDMASCFTANEMRDGGQTPGPLEDMRRMMSGLGAASPVLPNENACGGRKRKRMENKRRWVWTIGQEDEDDDDVGGAIAALRAQTADETPPSRAHFMSLALEARMPCAVECEELPTPSIESSVSAAAFSEVETSDSCSVVSSDEYQRRWLSEGEVGGKTPTASGGGQRKSDMPIAEVVNDSGELAQKSRSGA